MFVLDPDIYCLPSYRITPFSTQDVTVNANLPLSDEVDRYFTQRFDGNRFLYTENGRKAIEIALSHYGLSKTDVVTILTTTGNFYISGCVTKEIEKICNWSRTIEPNTKLLFLNHEFGQPYPDLESLKKLGLPIIEDCAHSFFPEEQMGHVGDFVIYSFPKAFPIQIGGLLQINLSHTAITYRLESERERYIKNVLSHYIGDEHRLRELRLKNYHYLRAEFQKIGLQTRFELAANSWPGVFMFCVNDVRIDLDRLKIHFNNHGIQSSVFYGERVYFIPCHHKLTKTDLDYFVAVMQHFLAQ
ncbi:MAG: DegT/DnrJ/EryC1/StrS family aminotransferase [Bacteroidales bacterium]